MESGSMVCSRSLMEFLCEIIWGAAGGRDKEIWVSDVQVTDEVNHQISLSLWFGFGVGPKLLLKQMGRRLRLSSGPLLHKRI